MRTCRLRVKTKAAAREKPKICLAFSDVLIAQIRKNIEKNNMWLSSVWWECCTYVAERMCKSVYHEQPHRGDCSRVMRFNVWWVLRRWGAIKWKHQGLWNMTKNNYPSSHFGCEFFHDSYTLLLDFRNHCNVHRFVTWTPNNDSYFIYSNIPFKF